MSRFLFLIVALSFSLGAVAQNPVIRDQYTADPTARVFGGRVYLYPSHDIFPPQGQRQDWFCMADYHVFSSENLTDWTDHGVIVSQEQVPWGKADGYSMWAPDCVEKQGRYYFYFPNGPKSGRGFAIGVAVADRPEGPFTLEPEPIRGVSGIDPCVLVDRDGKAYIYWSGMGIRGAQLKDNMKELAGELREITPPHREGQPQMPKMLVGGEEMKGLPEGFKEGPFAFRRGDWYYLTFPWVRKEKGTETLAYAMSRSPLGPWDFKGLIMQEHANGCWTNHHSLVEYRGEWFLFYHHNDYSPRDDKRRSVCIDRVSFNTDGTIREVTPTLRGVGVSKATARIEPDRYSAVSGPSVTIAFNDTANTFMGWHATLPQKGSWVRYDKVDFSGLTDGYLVINVKADANTSLSVREKNNKGKVIAHVDVTVEGQQGQFRRDNRGKWMSLTAPMTYHPKGVTDIVITCDGKPVSIDWLQFKQRPTYFTPVAANAAPSQPDECGFIRRWQLREPIPQNIRSNTIFTNTWLREFFADELSKLNPKKGKWYSLESENYNMKLFRFAEKYGRQAYGNLFWCQTVIDCPEDIEGVRLAAGSNGASMWWLNDEEVLLLEGDRRMVEDDGVSSRLKLKKGRNILRCAVVNGPGLSDFCVRFLDESGKELRKFVVL
ncbi:MAG: family 43 glycosylhydrolase [Bacteroidaceae bacterium]|nr:family 43 glycosylhydrolase [Bacteroidaceae bacterium]